MHIKISMSISIIISKDWKMFFQLRPYKKIQIVAKARTNVLVLLLTLTLSINILCSSAYSGIYYAGETYTFRIKSLNNETFNSQDYIYLWIFSDGTSNSNSEQILKWTAPIVNQPENVTITVYVTDNLNDCGCTGKDEIELTVFPKPPAINPQISVNKSADKPVVYKNSQVSYTYRVTNPGNDPLSSITVSDDKIQMVDFRGGDANSNGKLDLGEIWIYISEATLRQDTTNIATAKGLNSLGNYVQNTSIATVRVIDPSISISVTTSSDRIISGNTVIYTYEISNTGDDSLTGVSVRDSKSFLLNKQPDSPGNNNNVLDPGEKWVYKAYTTMPSYDVTNTGTVTAKDSLGVEVTASDAATVHVIKQSSEIAITKNADKTIINKNSEVTYTYQVTNTGHDPLSSIAVLDDKISEVNKQSGDFNNNNELDPGEKWIYSAKATLSRDTTNIATARGFNSSLGENGYYVQNSATVMVKVIDPSISISVKASPEQIYRGEEVIFTYIINNTCQSMLTGVVVADNMGLILNRQSDSSGNNDNVLDPGEKWIYTAAAIPSNDVTNIGTVTAKDSSDQEVTASDTAFVHVIPFHSLWINKTADKKAYSSGEIINYTIAFGTNDEIDYFANVIINDTLPDLKYIEYVDASRQPDVINGNVLLWKIGTLQGLTNGTIQLYIKIKDNCSDLRYKSSGSVSGEGFANIHQNLNSAQNPDYLINQVEIYNFINNEKFDLHSSSAIIQLTDALGIAVKLNGHGSGAYQREDQTLLFEKNRSIQVKTSLYESYHPISFALPQGRSIKYISKWSEAQTGKNRITGATLSEVYMYANRIKRENTIHLDENGSTLASETSFEGAGHVDVIKKDCGNPKAAPTYEAHESYLGSFKVNTNVDEYGVNVVSNRSVSGSGMAASDKRIKKSQRSYESGTGAYQVEDRMETQTNYMAKDINVSYAPVSYVYTPDFRLNLSKKWEEGMWSKSGALIPKGSQSTEPSSFIGEEFSGADYLKKNATAKGLNEMDTEAGFSGKAQFKVVKDSNSNDSDDVNLYDLYVGKYKVSRKTTLTGVARYDEPHITISKEGKVEPAGGRLVDYIITVVNDGNQALEPIYVLDLFPQGTEFVSSSLRPTQLASNYSKWTLTNLGVGSSSRIDLKLKMIEVTGSLINRVQAQGGYNNTWIVAENYSILRKGWLSCSLPQLLAAKEAYVDPKDPMLVHYRIFLKNQLNDTMAATVTDRLPGEMEFINSTVVPDYHESDKIVWNIIDLKPGENITIDYLVKSLQRGTFVNQAHIDATYLHGTESVSADVAASVDIGTGAYSSSMSVWKPPGCFGLNCSQQGFVDEWMPCYSCGESEPQPIGGSPLDSSCLACASSGERDIP
jgi:uncharacterized repeat protein (TIGR01451 family)